MAWGYIVQLESSSIAQCIATYLFSLALLSRKKPLKRTALKKKSKKRDSVSEEDKKLYARVWGARPHRCEECDVFLGETPIPHFFSHVLTKAAHPRLRHVDLNIALLCFSCHNWYEFGKRSEMKTHEKTQEIIQQLYDIENS